LNDGILTGERPKRTRRRRLIPLTGLPPEPGEGYEEVADDDFDSDNDEWDYEDVKVGRRRFKVYETRRFSILGLLRLKTLRLAAAVFFTMLGCVLRFSIHEEVFLKKRPLRSYLNTLAASHISHTHACYAYRTCCGLSFFGDWLSARQSDSKDAERKGKAKARASRESRTSLAAGDEAAAGGGRTSGGGGSPSGGGGVSGSVIGGVSGGGGASGGRAKGRQARAAQGGPTSDERAGLMENGGWEAQPNQAEEAPANPILRLANFVNGLKDRGEAKKAEVKTGMPNKREDQQNQVEEAPANPILRLANFVNGLKDRGEAKKAEVKTGMPNKRQAQIFCLYTKENVLICPSPVGFVKYFY
jgi:hypothetical protein